MEWENYLREWIGSKMRKNGAINGSEPAEIRQATAKGTPKCSSEKEECGRKKWGSTLLCMGRLVTPNWLVWLVAPLALTRLRTHGDSCMDAFGRDTCSVVTSRTACSGTAGSTWRHVSRQPTLSCHGGTRSHQGEWRNLVQYRATTISVTKRAKTGNKVFVGSFLEYDF
jgi:hypothetical protein